LVQNEDVGNLNIEIDSMPAELDQIERRIRQLETSSARL
jgi:hypothetical protein